MNDPNSMAKALLGMDPTFAPYNDQPTLDEQTRQFLEQQRRMQMDPGMEQSPGMLMQPPPKFRMAGDLIQGPWSTSPAVAADKNNQNAIKGIPDKRIDTTNVLDPTGRFDDYLRFILRGK